MDQILMETDPMARAKKSGEPESRRVRPRPNAVMVDMDDATRAMLEAIRDERARETDEPTSLASTVRHLVKADFLRRKLKPRTG